MKFSGKTFADETVNFDDNSFEKCTFIRCRLVYKGGMFQFVDNKLDGSKIVFDGGARNTIQFLTDLYRVGSVNVVEKIFEDIRSGSAPTTTSDAVN